MCPMCPITFWILITFSEEEREEEKYIMVGKVMRHIGHMGHSAMIVVPVRYPNRARKRAAPLIYGNPKGDRLGWDANDSGKESVRPLLQPDSRCEFGITHMQDEVKDSRQNNLPDHRFPRGWIS
jgi:hypothetical protein